MTNGVGVANESCSNEGSENRREAQVRQEIKILLVDDHAVFRAGLRLLIESRPGMVVVAEAGNPADALECARREQPDIVLLDLDLGEGQSGLDLMEPLSAAATSAKILVLTGVRDSETQQRAIALGSLGLVSKERAAQDVLGAIEKVYAGEAWLDGWLMANVVKKMSRHEADPHNEMEKARASLLSKRELEVASLIAQGMKNREIGERLFISPTTVRHHVTSIFNKLNVNNRFELIIFLYHHHLAAPPATPPVTDELVSELPCQHAENGPKRP